MLKLLANLYFRIGSSVRCSGHDEYWNNEHVSYVPAGATKELEKVEKTNLT
jgi:hypothetical protein